MNIFQQYLAEEFAEEYQEGRISRREALKLIAGVTGSMFLANSILAACTPLAQDELAPSPSATPAMPTGEATAAAAASPGPIATEAATETTIASTETPPSEGAGSTAHGTVSPDDPEVQAVLVEIHRRAGPPRAPLRGTPRRLDHAVGVHQRKGGSEESRPPRQGKGNHGSPHPPGATQGRCKRPGAWDPGRRRSR